MNKFEWQKALRNSGLKPALQGTAMALAGYADPDGSNIRPSVPRLAADLNVSERTIHGHIAILLREGWITQVSKGHYGRASVYRLSAPTKVEETRNASSVAPELTLYPDTHDAAVRQPQSKPDTSAGHHSDGSPMGICPLCDRPVVDDLVEGTYGYVHGQWAPLTVYHGACIKMSVPDFEYTPVVHVPAGTVMSVPEGLTLASVIDGIVFVRHLPEPHLAYLASKGITRSAGLHQWAVDRRIADGVPVGTLNGEHVIFLENMNIVVQEPIPA